MEWKSDSVIKPDDYNHLAVSARGPIFNFYINDKLVDTVEDSGITSGSIGTILEIYDGGSASISYDNFIVRGIR